MKTLLVFAILLASCSTAAIAVRTPKVGDHVCPKACPKGCKPVVFKINHDGSVWTNPGCKWKVGLYQPEDLEAPK